MQLWSEWYLLVKELRPAFSRNRTYLWFITCLIGLSIRTDLLGATSIIRAIGLKSEYYDRILDFFHSNAVCPDILAKKWTSIVLKNFPLIKFNGRPVFTADGIKVPKSGKRMPGVKLLHQQSESNTKPEYIMGHSFQAVGILCGLFNGVFSVPLTSRIHEGIKLAPNDKRTLLDKMVELITGLECGVPGILVADAYYASRKIILPLIEQGWDLVSRVRTNGKAYYPPTDNMQPKGRGRKKKYGEKVKLKDLVTEDSNMIEIASPVYGEENVRIKYLSIDLLWKPIGDLVRFVLVKHPVRGTIFLMASNLTLKPEDIIKIYAYRFKIEVSFKQILRIISGYGYHFWMKRLKPVKRKSGDTYIHREAMEYKNSVKRKLRAYHLYVQTSIIVQGAMMYLALLHSELVWGGFRTWMRTMNTKSVPSEFVTAGALRNSFSEFLWDSENECKLKKFITDRLDYSQLDTLDLAA